MTRLLEGFIKWSFLVVIVYLSFKHWVGGTNLIRTGLRELRDFYVGLAEPRIAARKIG